MKKLINASGRIGFGLYGLLGAVAIAAEELETTALKSPGHPLLWLAIFTLAIVGVVAGWQFSRVQKAKRENQHATVGGARADVKTYGREP